MMKILFVCLGNICRSCTAEEVMRTFVERHHLSHCVEVDSAGIADYHEGELPDDRMRSAARSCGYELTHRSRPVCTADFDRFDILVAMDAFVENNLRKLAPKNGAEQKIVRMADYLSTPRPERDIPDPYYGDADDFRLVVALLEDACTHLLQQLLFNGECDKKSL